MTSATSTDSPVGPVRDEGRQPMIIGGKPSKALELRSAVARGQA